MQWCPIIMTEASVFMGMLHKSSSVTACHSFLACVGISQDDFRVLSRASLYISKSILHATMQLERL